LGFLPLVEAQRQWIDARIKQAQALAEYHLRLAELEQAIAGPVPFSAAAEEVPSPTT
jgi:outer membrane protein TolC